MVLQTVVSTVTTKLCKLSTRLFVCLYTCFLFPFVGNQETCTHKIFLLTTVVCIFCPSHLYDYFKMKCTDTRDLTQVSGGIVDKPYSRIWTYTTTFGCTCLLYREHPKTNENALSLSEFLCCSRLIRTGKIASIPQWLGVQLILSGCWCRNSSSSPPFPQFPWLFPLAARASGGWQVPLPDQYLFYCQRYIKGRESGAGVLVTIDTRKLCRKQIAAQERKGSDRREGGGGWGMSLYLNLNLNNP